jgi:hypothetical protein
MCIWGDPKRNTLCCCGAQVLFDVDYRVEFKIGTKVLIGASWCNKTSTYKWSGEARVKDIKMPLKYVKAAQVDTDSVCLLTPSHLLLEGLKLTADANRPSSLAQGKFLKGVLLSDTGSCLNETPRSLKELINANNEGIDVNNFYADVKCLITAEVRKEKEKDTADKKKKENKKKEKKAVTGTVKSKAVKSIKKKHAADPDDSDAASATAESDHESSTND